MFRVVAKWYISRSIDCDLPLPKWVEKRIDVDQGVKLFYQQSLRLASRLQAADIETNRSPSQLLTTQLDSRSYDTNTTLSLSKFRGRIAAAVVALAAVVLVMLAPWFKSFPQTELVEKNEQVVTPEPMNSSELQKERGMRELKSLVSASREMLQSVKLRASKSVEPIADPMLDTQQFVEFLEMDADQIAEQVVDPAEQVGASYGQMLTGVDKQLAEDNRRMLASGIEAWKYFTYEVPQQAASLAGWSAPQ